MSLLDLSDVKESNYGVVPPGTYKVIMDDCEMKTTKSGTGEYINAKLRILGGQYDGRMIFNMFNVKNESKQAMDIGRAQLKEFLKCSGAQDPNKLESVMDLVGMRCDAVVKIKTDSYGEKNVISYFKAPTEVNEAVHKETTPF